MFRKAFTVSLIITVVAIMGGLYLNTAITIQSPIDNPPQITSLKIEKTHNDPARIRKDYTFFFDFTMEATDDHKITWAFVIICEPDGNKTTINLVEVSGKYSDAFQAWDSGNYVFQFNVIDDANQKTVLETNRTIVYGTFARASISTTPGFTTFLFLSTIEPANMYPESSPTLFSPILYRCQFFNQLEIIFHTKTGLSLRIKKQRISVIK